MYVWIGEQPKRTYANRTRKYTAEYTNVHTKFVYSQIQFTAPVLSGKAVFTLSSFNCKKIVNET